MNLEFTPAAFVIADAGADAPRYLGYQSYYHSRPEHWNGWAKPYFERADADRVMADANAAGGGTVTYNAAADAYESIPLDQEPDELTNEVPGPETFAGLDIELPDGTRRHVYPLGAGSWCWEAL